MRRAFLRSARPILRRNLGTIGSRITARLFGGYFGEQTHADQLTVGRVQPVLTVKHFDEMTCKKDIIENGSLTFKRKNFRVFSATQRKECRKFIDECGFAVLDIFSPVTALNHSPREALTNFH